MKHAEEWIKADNVERGVEIVRAAIDPLAQRLAAMGWPRHAIRRACRLSPAGLARAMRPGINGLWGHHAARIARELRGAA